MHSNHFLTFLRFITVCLIFFLLPVSCEKQQSTAALATFDGGEVTVEEYVHYFLASTKYKPDVMPDEDNLRDIVSLKAFEKMALKEAVQRGLEQDSLYIESFENNKRKTLFFKYMREQIINQVINDSLINVYYQNFSPQHQLAYIVRPVKRSASEAFAKTQRDTIDMAYRELLAGNEFAKVAEKYSQDINSNQKGGRIGWVTRESLGDAVLRSVLDTLKQHQFSQPVRGYEAYYILYRGDSRKVEAPPLSEARDRIWQSLYHSRKHEVDAALAKRFAELAEKYHYQKNESVIEDVFKKAGANRSTTVTTLLDFDGLTEKDMALGIAKYDGGKISLYELFEEKNRNPDNKYEFLQRLELVAQRHLLAKHAEELGYQDDPEVSAKLKDVRESLLRSFLYRYEVVDKAQARPLVTDKVDEFQHATAQRFYKEQLEKRMNEKYHFQLVESNFKLAMKRARDKKTEQNNREQKS